MKKKNKFLFIDFIMALVSFMVLYSLGAPDWVAYCFTILVFLLANIHSVLILLMLMGGIND